jgi:arylsulfatase
LILHWPRGIAQAGELRHRPGQLTDIMATVLDVSGAVYPDMHQGHAVPPCEGESLVRSFASDDRERGPLFWEHEGNAAVRVGKWKLVRKYPGPWELYDTEADRTEMHDIAERHPQRVAEMSALYAAWAERCGVIPREKILELMKAQPGAAFWEEPSDE